ncbi:MAG: glycosyltransferase, partial [Bacteroidales bacterium]|nr:glycosyltransferase [Bacteroidales bacterium]
MKVMILGTCWPYRGGLAAFNERLARQYQQEGHEVELVTFTLQYPSFLFPGKTQYSDEPAPEGLSIVRKLNAINPISWWLTGRYIRRRRPDLLITKFWLPFMAPALGIANRVARRKGLFRVSILDNLIPHEKRPGDKPLARFFVGSVDAMVA